MQRRTGESALRLPRPRYLVSTAVKLNGVREQLAKSFVASSIADTCRQLHATLGRSNRAKACTMLSSRNSQLATGSPIKQNGRGDTQSLWDRIAPAPPLAIKSSRGKQKSCSSEAPSQSPAWPPLSRAVMAELTPAWKGHRLFSPVARTPVPGIHGCQAKACSEQVAKSFVASSIAHTCWQSHSAADHANLANACTMLSSSSTFAIGSLIKQIGGNDIKTSWDRTAFTLPFSFLHCKSSIRRQKSCSSEAPFPTQAYLPLLVH